MYALDIIRNREIETRQRTVRQALYEEGHWEASDLLAHGNEFTVPGSPSRRSDGLHPDWTVQRRRQTEGHSLWAICDGGNCLGIGGQWTYERMPSSRTDLWLRNNRWANFPQAMQVAMAVAKLYQEIPTEAIWELSRSDRKEEAKKLLALRDGRTVRLVRKLRKGWKP